MWVARELESGKAGVTSAIANMALREERDV